MDYTKQALEELAKSYPPPGHPHYISIEERLGLVFDPIEGKLVEKSTFQKRETKMSSAAATKYQELKAKITEAKKQMEETAKTAFTDMAKEFFANNPTVLAFGWTQYTPYWNDGEPCEFRAQTDYPTVTMAVDGQALTYDSNRGDITDNDGEELRTAESWSREVFEPMPKYARVSPINVEGRSVAYDWATKQVTIDGVPVKSHSQLTDGFDDAEKQVAEFLGNFEDDDLETMFGDHIQIMVARDGTIETEEYQHD